MTSNTVILIISHPVGANSIPVWWNYERKACVLHYKLNIVLIMA